MTSMLISVVGIGAQSSACCTFSSAEGTEHGKLGTVQESIETVSSAWGSSRVDEIPNAHCMSGPSDLLPEHKAHSMFGDAIAKDAERTGSGISLWGTQSEPLSRPSMFTRSSVDLETLRAALCTSSDVERTSSMSALQLKRLFNNAFPAYYKMALALSLM